MVPGTFLILTALLSSSLSWAGAPAALPLDALPVPLVRQATAYSCGAASLLSVAYYWQAYESFESSLYFRLGTSPEFGTAPEKITAVARQLGLEADLRENLTERDLRFFLKSGKTVILDLQAWRDSNTPWNQDWEDGHYVVLTALDRHRAYFMDPALSAGYGYMPIGELMDRWHDVRPCDGKILQTTHLGIVISGQNRPRAFPRSLVRIR